MKIIKKIFVFFFTILILSTYIASPSQKLQEPLKKNEISSILKGGDLEIFDGFKILYINGSNYQMGYQHGFLLKNEVQENVRAFIKLAEKSSSYEDLINLWNIMKPYIPCCYIEEMQGIADGANVNLEDLAVTYMYVIFYDMRCFSYAAWSDATKDNNLYHIRSLDFSLLIQDPITNKYIQENSVIIIRKPENGLKTVTPSISGWINFYEGINEKQISIGVQVCWSDDQTLKGIPAIFRVQKALDFANNISEAIDILTSNKTIGWNFIVSDGKTSEAYAVETSANLTYVGTWNNSIENNHPFWKIKNVVRRTNFFIDPDLASTQRKHYNIGGFFNFLKMITGRGGGFYLLWRKYNSMSKEINKNWGKINLNKSISLLRKVYDGKTDLLLFIFINRYKGSIFCDFHQWSFCPENGNFVISFADAKDYSHKTKLHYFNINDFFA